MVPTDSVLLGGFEERVRLLQEQLPTWMEEAEVPGLAIAVVGDGASWCRGYGVGNIVDPRPVDEDTVFEACSLSKPLFAYGVLRLYEQGLLDLDAPLGGYLESPYLSDEPWLERISARHVLSHTAGFTNWRPEGGRLRVHLEPGMRFSYSGEGFVYLQRVVEALVGCSAEEWMQDTLLGPLGMDDSSFVWPSDGEKPLATGHDVSGRPVNKQVWPEMNAASSLHTTAADFSRYLHAMVRPDRDSADPVGANTLAQMLCSQISVNDCKPWDYDWPRLRVALDTCISWGLGWGLQRSGERVGFWQPGDNGPYKSMAFGFKDEGLAMVVLTNSARGAELWPKLVPAALGGTHPAIAWSQSSPKIADRPPACIEVVEGDLPIVFALPHDGDLGLPGVVPRRNIARDSHFNTTSARHTREIALEVALALEGHTGKRPWLVINRLARSYADLDRTPRTAFEHRYTAELYNGYHRRLKETIAQLKKVFGNGLLLIIDAQETFPADIYIGSLESRSIAGLKDKYTTSVLDGEYSLGHQLTRAGYKLPSFSTSIDLGQGLIQDIPATVPRPLDGGQVLERHGSHQPEGIDALSLVLHERVRGPLQERRRLIKALALAVAGFVRAFLPVQDADSGHASAQTR